MKQETNRESADKRRIKRGLTPLPKKFAKCLSVSVHRHRHIKREKQATIKKFLAKK